MLKRARSLLQEASAYWGLLPAIGGSGVSGLVVAWAAHVTALLKPYAPLSWVLAGFLGAWLFMISAYIFAVVRDRIIVANVNRRFYEQIDRINPLQNTFEKQRIRIDDLVSPIRPLVSKKNFIECELIGPANIRFAASSMRNNEFIMVDFVYCDNDTFPLNGVIFAECSMRNCKLFKITFLISDKDTGFSEGPNFNWLNSKKGILPNHDEQKQAD